MSRSDVTSELSRYSRQMLCAGVGEEGQRALLAARVVLIGCGALGSMLASLLTRAGAGFIRIIDRDFVEFSNLQRQVLFDEQDVADNLPKAEAAARKLLRVNSQVRIEPVVTDLNAVNAESLCSGCDLLLDGTDNFETRFLVNDLAVQSGRPWVYGAVIGAEGLVMPVLPGDTPCLRCVWEDVPPPGVSPTCDTAGVLGPVVGVVASLQAVEAMKLMMGKRAEVTRALLTIDAWSGTVRRLDLRAARERGDCPCCGRRSFEFLRGNRESAGAVLCGRNAVQVLPPAGTRVDFSLLAERLAFARPARNAFLMKFAADGLSFTLFPDGRAIIQGTQDIATARSAYARFIGS